MPSASWASRLTDAVSVPRGSQWSTTTRIRTGGLAAICQRNPMPKQTAFVIDFGTTNTRVAYYDGQRLRMVPFITAAGQSFQLPTLVSYRNGEPVAYGAEARRQQ